MDGFRMVGGVARIDDPDLYSTWQDREDYLAALTASADPAEAAKKGVVLEFETGVARAIRADRIDAEIDDLVERYLIEDYRQHTPGIGHGRVALATFFRAGAMKTAPPLPLALTVEGDLVTVLLSLLKPDPEAPGQEYAVYLPALFRVERGRLTEHWGFGEKSAP